MRVLGLDIGTTTVCGTVVDVSTGDVVAVKTLANDTFIEGESFERRQDPDKIFALVESLYAELCTPENNVKAVGVTGQMHGIVYLDKKGTPVSLLYTWQDRRGDLPMAKGQTYTEFLSSCTGYPLAAGFGSVTHFYNQKNNLVPQNAAVFCTIHDYTAMKLAQRSTPVVHVSDAASLGLFALPAGDFDHEAIQKAQMNPAMFPEVTDKGAPIGQTAEGLPVMPAIGDNQASFIGSVDRPSAILVNVGTGSQISVLSKALMLSEAAETRPMGGGEYLLVGSSLCGGRAYQMLSEFFAAAVKEATGQEVKMYPWMDRLAEDFETLTDKLTVSTRFAGTRKIPSERGGVYNLSLDNFTPAHFIVGVMEGVVEELFEVYSKLEGLSPEMMVGSGNGIRKSPVLQRIFEKRFGLPLRIPRHSEEAAYGAALFAMAGAGFYKNLAEAQKVIQYL